MDGPQRAREHPLKAIAKPGIDAVRRMWLPFVLIQLCAVAVVVAYYRSESVRAVCERLAEIKRAGGLGLAAGAMAFASGVLPEVFKLLTSADNRTPHQRLRDLTFNIALFALSGIYCDVFYNWLSRIFPGPNTPFTVTAKVLIDQFVYSPVIGFTWMAVCYTWREHRYRLGPTLRSFGAAWYISRVAPIMLPGWAYWIPMCFLMYALPSSLTFVFGVTGSAAAATILVTVAARKTQLQEDRARATSVPTTNPSHLPS